MAERRGRRQPRESRSSTDPTSLLPWVNGTFGPIKWSGQDRPYGAAKSDPLDREGPGWHKGDNGLPVLKKGWRYDKKTKRTTIIPGGVADPERKT